MVALHADFWRQEVERLEERGVSGRWQRETLRRVEQLARAAEAAQPQTEPTLRFAAPPGVGRPGDSAAPNVAVVRETPGRPAEQPFQLDLGDDRRAVAREEAPKKGASWRQHAERFPSHFAVTATYGLTTVRYVGTSVAACEKWAAEQAARGHVVSEPWPFDGDNVFQIDAKESA